MITDVFEYNQHFVAMMNIINAARLNPPECGHKHHIIPRCWYKMNNLPIDNSKDNLVLLTPEDHKKVHKLAAYCIIGSDMRSKMGFACVLLRGSFAGMHHTEESKKKISEASKRRVGHMLSVEHKYKIGLKSKGRQARLGMPTSEFGVKFVEHFGTNYCDNKELYNKEHVWYRRHNNTCRWEQNESRI